MIHADYFDGLVREIRQGEVEHSCVHLLSALNDASRTDNARYAAMRSELRAHELHALLLEDPFTGRAWSKPRGYAGDAELIDLLYDQVPPPGTSALGASLLAVTSEVSSSVAVRHRRNYGAEKLEAAWRSGKQVCVLACGHLREADGLAGQDLGNVVAVDLDGSSLEQVAARHGESVNLVQDNALTFLRAAIRSGRTFDYIYSLGLTDYFDDREILFLHRVMARCLAPGGEILVANFVPHHQAFGWMDAIMDWNLVYRTEGDMERFANSVGLGSRTIRDPTGTIVYSEVSTV